MNASALRRFLSERGGNIGPFATAEQVSRFRELGARTCRGRLGGDPQVLGSAETAGVRVLIRDGKLLERFPGLTEEF